MIFEKGGYCKPSIRFKMVLEKLGNIEHFGKTSLQVIVVNFIEKHSFLLDNIHQVGKQNSSLSDHAVLDFMLSYS